LPSLPFLLPLPDPVKELVFVKAPGPQAKQAKTLSFLLFLLSLPFSLPLHDSAEELNL
jgi:hypothetical protein